MPDRREPAVLRTPEERFAGLAEWPYESRSHEVGGLRMAYVDEGPPAAAPVLLLHGEPSWSYLYRRMIPGLVAAGHRVIAPDLIGFGRSDKPVARAAYSYQSHVDWTSALVDGLGLREITLFCQDWGGLIGLRLVAAEPTKFARVVASNTFLPTGDWKPPEAFFAWQRHSQQTPELAVGRIVASGCARPVAPEVIAAYDAPFADERYKAGARQFPLLVPTRPDDPASAANRAAWEVLQAWRKPFLTVFGDSDPITRGADRLLQQWIPGTTGEPHQVLANCGHFIQEDAGPELAGIINAFIAESRSAGAA